MIEPGLDFVEVLQEAVGSCDALIAVIGRQWVTIVDAAGQRRLENPEDFVRLEIAAALERNIRVIPALVHGASMPRSTELPEVLQRLARRNALDISDGRFHSDVDRLIVVLEKVLGGSQPSPTATSQASAIPLKEQPSGSQPPSTPTPSQASRRGPRATGRSSGAQSPPTPVASKASLITSTANTELTSNRLPFEPETVLIPVGEFCMGSDPRRDKSAELNEQPQHTLNLHAYYLAKTPVTNAQYQAFVQATGHTRPWH